MADDRELGVEIADETGAQMIADARERAKVAAQLAARELFERAGNPAEIGRTELELTASLAILFQEGYLVGFLQGTVAGARDSMRIIQEIFGNNEAALRASRH